MDYQKNFDIVSDRYYSYLTCRLDRQIALASDKEYAALMFFCGSDELKPTSLDPFQDEMFSLFNHYYKLNPNNAISNLVNELEEMKNRHLKQASKFPRIKSRSLKYYRVISDNWFKRKIGSLSIHTEVETGNYDTFFLDNYSIMNSLRFLMKILVYERINIYAKEKYSFMEGLEEKTDMIVKRFLPKDKSNLGSSSSKSLLQERHNIKYKWNVSKRVTTDILNQLTNLTFYDRKSKSELPILTINAENFAELLKVLDNRFANTSYETIYDYRKPDKHKPRKNGVKIIVSHNPESS